MLSSAFLAEFRRATEAKWRVRSLDRRLYGFQLQRGTRWNPGLPDAVIADYEGSLGVRFPHDMKCFLREMNGTDLPTLNLHGNSGEPPRRSTGVYAYPRDLDIVKRRIASLKDIRAELTAALAELGFDLPAEAGLTPIYGHRYVVCASDLARSVVLSIGDGADVVVYGNSLQEYLEREFLRADLHRAGVRDKAAVMMPDLKDKRRIGERLQQNRRSTGELIEVALVESKRREGLPEAPLADEGRPGGAGGGTAIPGVSAGRMIPRVCL